MAALRLAWLVPVTASTQFVLAFMLIAPAFAQSREELTRDWLKFFQENPDIAATMRQCRAAGRSIQECAQEANELFAAKERANAAALQSGLEALEADRKRHQQALEQQQQKADQDFRDVQQRDLEGRVQRLERGF